MPPRPGSLPPAAPGLPQRPAVSPPSVNAFQMQQMHQGQASVPSSQSAGPAQIGGWAQPPGANNTWHDNSPPGVPPPGLSGLPMTSTNLPAQLGNPPSSNVSNPNAAETAEAARSKPAMAAGEVTEPKVKKEKDKEKATKLIYPDNEVSPEEKMASLPRYAFAPIKREETVLGEATTPAVTGVVDGHDIRS